MRDYVLPGICGLVFMLGSALLDPHKTTSPALTDPATASEVSGVAEQLCSFPGTSSGSKGSPVRTAFYPDDLQQAVSPAVSVEEPSTSTLLR